MDNQDLFGAVLFIPEITIADFFIALSGRFSLAVDNKNILKEACKNLPAAKNPAELSVIKMPE